MNGYIPIRVIPYEDRQPSVGDDTPIPVYKTRQGAQRAAVKAAGNWGEVWELDLSKFETIQ